MSDSECYSEEYMSDSEINIGHFEVTRYIQIPVKGDTGSQGNTGPQGNVGNTGATGAQGPQGVGSYKQTVNLSNDYVFSSGGFGALPLSLYVTTNSAEQAIVFFNGSGQSTTLVPGVIKFQLLQNGAFAGSGKAIVQNTGTGYEWTTSFVGAVTLAPNIVQTFNIVAQEYNSSSGCYASKSPSENAFNFTIIYNNSG